MQSTAPIRICAPFDPAIDPTKSDTSAYAMWHDEADVVPFPGETITWFTCRLLDTAQVADLECTILGEKARFREAFLYSVLAVEGYKARDGQIRDWAPGWAEKDRTDHTGRMTREESKLFDADVQLTIGEAVYRASGFFGGGRPRFWRPQPWCVDALADLPYHHAGKIRAESLQRRAERLDPKTKKSGDT